MRRLNTFLAFGLAGVLALLGGLSWVRWSTPTIPISPVRKGSSPRQPDYVAFLVVSSWS
jgi:hypothetical protein